MHHMYRLHMVMIVCSASRNTTACLVYLIFLYSLQHMYAYLLSLIPLVPRVTSSCLASVPLPASGRMAHSHQPRFCRRSRRHRHVCSSSDLEHGPLTDSLRQYLPSAAVSRRFRVIAIGCACHSMSSVCRMPCADRAISCVRRERNSC